MTDKEYMLDVVVNPLSWADVDFNEKINDTSAVKYLCTKSNNSNISDLVDHYKEINEAGRHIPIVPAQKDILEKLIWPLKAAKGSYVLGNYLGTIAMCGMVAEMIAILQWEMSDMRINGNPMSGKEERNLFGKTFEKLGQERRISVLYAYGIIDEETKNFLDDIKKKRNHYLHLFTKGHTDIRNDAVSVFAATTKLVSGTIIHGFEKGKVLLNPKMSHYLKKLNFIK